MSSPDSVLPSADESSSISWSMSIILIEEEREWRKRQLMYGKGGRRIDDDALRVVK
jgi:hypothetical protein